MLAPPFHSREIGSPRTHRRFLSRIDGTYGPIPTKRLNGMLGMPLSRTEINGLYCAGDSTFPGQVGHPIPIGAAVVTPTLPIRLASLHGLDLSSFRCLLLWLCNLPHPPFLATSPFLESGGQINLLLPFPPTCLALN